jgi:hypothetical protein
LLVVCLIRASVPIVAVVGVVVDGRGGVRGSRLLGGVVVVVVGLRGVVSGSSCPTCAVEGLTAGFATATCSEATDGDVSTGWLRMCEWRDLPAEHKEEEEADDYNAEDEPSHPVVPCTTAAGIVGPPILVIASGHVVLVL